MIAATPRNLSRRLRTLVTTFERNDLRSSLRDKQPALLWRWPRHGGGEGEAQKLCGAWLESVPSSNALTLDRHIFGWALRERLHLNASLVGLPCRATLPNGEPCPHVIDLFARHHLVCDQGASFRRHNHM